MAHKQQMSSAPLPLAQWALTSSLGRQRQHASDHTTLDGHEVDTDSALLDSPCP